MRIAIAITIIIILHLRDTFDFFVVSKTLTGYNILKDGDCTMKWEEVRKIYPNRYVLLQVLENHVEGDKKYIDDVAIIRAIDDSKEATRELVNAKPGTIVYHTAKEKIEVLIRKRVGFRGVM